MKGHIKTARILNGSGKRGKERAPAPCGICGIVFLLYPWEDLPCYKPCRGKQKKKV